MFKEEMKMKSFSYTVKDELGIHARPAGMLVKEVKNFQSKVTLEKDGKSVDASRLMAVMGMGVKKNQTVTVTVEGDDEDAACDAIKAFFETNL
jgi:phosphocarrier protein HPr